MRYFFPDLWKSSKPLLCLDMDLTLVQTRLGLSQPADIQMTLSQGAARVSYSVILRPGLSEFLKQTSQLYDLLIFTSAGQLYADSLIDRFDRERLIRHRVYQQHCTQLVDAGIPVFVKDLSRLGQSLDRVLLVDDNPRSAQFQPQNAIIIRAFDGAKADRELYRLSDRLKRVHETWT